MRKLLFILLGLSGSACAQQPRSLPEDLPLPRHPFVTLVARPAPAEKPAPAAPASTPAPAPEISRDDIRRTVEHMIVLSKQQQATLEKAQDDNALLHIELIASQKADAIAQQRVIETQKAVDSLTEERNRQAKRADKAEEQADYWHAKQKAAVKKLWFWRFFATCGIVFNVVMLALGLAIRFTKWGAENLAPIARKILI